MQNTNLFADEAPALAGFLDASFRTFVLKNEREIHDIVDDIVAKAKTTSGKGHKASVASVVGQAMQHWMRDPQLQPTRAEVKRNSYTSPLTRSTLEPLAERVSLASSVAELFAAAALECREAVQSIVKACRARKVKFFDESFYFDRRDSLYPFPGTPDDCTVTEPKRAMRLTELYKNAVLFADTISSNDMTQGGVGNCFFVGAVGALAAHSNDAIHQLFVDHDLETGVYGVCFFKNGTWEWVIVDDFIAVQEDRSGNFFPLYASSGQGGAVEFWPMILEKAYAKTHRNWDTIDGGWAREALVDLTGGLETSYDLNGDNRDMAFHAFRRDVDDPHTILSCAVGMHVEATAGAGRAGEHSALFGLFHGHQYSVINAKETPDGACFVHVRNPWGNEAEWKGPYSDNDIEWRKNPAHYKFINPNFGHDGCFWMRWEDFKKYFTDIDVVRKFPNDFKTLTIPFCGERILAPQNTFVLRVFHKPADITIVFSQEDPKIIDDHVKQKGTAYLPLKMMITSYADLPTDVSELESLPHQTVSSVKGRQRAISAAMKLDPGVYCVSASIRTNADDSGVFLRLFGPPDSTFAVFRWCDGEKAALGVGKFREPLVVAETARATGSMVISPSMVPAPPPSLQHQPTLIVAPAGQQHADPAATQTLERQLARQTKYAEELEALVANLQAELAEAKAAVKATTSASRAASAARSATSVPTAVAGTSASPTGIARLGMDRAGFREAAAQVFQELAGKSGYIDRGAAVNGVRLVVTLGAGMDETFLRVHDELLNGSDSLSRNDFLRVCEACVAKWAVLQA